MEPVNSTGASEFFPKGFSGYPALQRLLFPLCSAVYLATLLGSTAIVAVSLLDVHLHALLYFSLGNLSVLDICYTSTFVALMLVHFLTARKTISFTGCAIQMCLSLSTGSTGCLLLAIRAYDRCLAICRPLRYPMLTSRRLSELLAGAAWALCLLKPVTETVPAVRLPFCRHHVVSHFTTELLEEPKPACGDTSVSEALLPAGSVLLRPTPPALICLSYALILATVLRVPSAAGRRKAFSTSLAHLAVGLLFYGTVGVAYVKPQSKEACVSDKVFTLLCAVVTPMLNPIICRLSNKEVKEAARKAWGRSAPPGEAGRAWAPAWPRGQARPPAGPREGGMGTSPRVWYLHPRRPPTGASKAH